MCCSRRETSAPRTSHSEIVELEGKVARLMIWATRGSAKTGIALPYSLAW